jgi:hypothetical protein
MTYNTPYGPSEPPPEEYVFEPPPEAYTPQGDEYEPEPFMVAPGQPVLPGFDPPPADPADNWSWLDARFVGLEQVDAAGELAGYEVGCVDLYADTVSGDLGGAFLRLQAFGPDELESAENLFHRLNTYAYDQDLAAYHLPDLAERAAATIAGREGVEVPRWRALTSDEYAFVERVFGLVQDVEPDIPPEYAHDELLRTAYELGGVLVEIKTRTRTRQRRPWRASVSWQRVSTPITTCRRSTMRIPTPPTGLACTSPIPMTVKCVCPASSRSPGPPAPARTKPSLRRAWPEIGTKPTKPAST